MLLGNSKLIAPQHIPAPFSFEFLGTIGVCSSLSEYE